MLPPGCSRLPTRADVSKVYYITQIRGQAAHLRVASATVQSLFHFSYQRYLENQLRAVFGFEGTPIKLIIRQKGEAGDKV